MVLAEFVKSWLDINNTRTLQTPGFPGEFNIKLLLSVDDIKEDSAFFSRGYILNHTLQPEYLWIIKVMICT